MAADVQSNWHEIMSSLFSRLRAAARRFEASVLAVLLLTLVALVLLQVASRLLGDPVRWTEEVARFVIIWLTFLGAAACVRTREHVAFELLAHYVRKKPKLRSTLNVVVVSTTIVFMLVLLVTSLDWVSTVRDMGLHAVTIGVPTYIIALIVPISALLSIAYSLRRFRASSVEDEAEIPTPEAGGDMVSSHKD